MARKLKGNRKETGGVSKAQENIETHGSTSIEDLPKKQDLPAKRAQEAIDRVSFFIKKNKRLGLQGTEAEKILAEAEREYAERNYDKALAKASAAEHAVHHAIFEHQRARRETTSRSVEDTTSE